MKPEDFVRMPFGKHRGKLIQDVPIDYLKWCFREWDWTDNELLRRAIESHLAGTSRGHQDPEPKQTRRPVDDLCSKLRSWKRGLAMDYHPDRRGGSSDAMSALNEAFERLAKTLDIRL
jgi:hypothetical protein